MTDPTTPRPTDAARDKEFYDGLARFRPYTKEMEMEGRGWPGYFGDRREIGAVIDGDHIIYVDGEGNPLEPSWVLRTLRGTDDIPGPDPNEHPWMLARTNR